MPTNLNVTGMSCGGCEQSVVEALERVDDVEHAEADRTHDLARVEGHADTEDLVEAVERVGYSAST